MTREDQYKYPRTVSKLDKMSLAAGTTAQDLVFAGEQSDIEDRNEEPRPLCRRTTAENKARSAMDIVGRVEGTLPVSSLIPADAEADDGASTTVPPDPNVIEGRIKGTIPRFDRRVRHQKSSIEWMMKNKKGGAIKGKTSGIAQAKKGMRSSPSAAKAAAARPNKARKRSASSSRVPQQKQQASSQPQQLRRSQRLQNKRAKQDSNKKV